MNLLLVPTVVLKYKSHLSLNMTNEKTVKLLNKIYFFFETSVGM